MMDQLAHRLKVTLGLALTCSAALADLQLPYDWSREDLTSYGEEIAKAAVPSQAICRAHLGDEPPLTDYAEPHEQVAAKDCDSEALYFGIGMPPDPVRARKCALIERRDSQGEPYQDYFMGSGILMMVYANGKGAARNYDIAIHMACGIPDTVPATEARINELAARKAGRGEPGDIGICQHATSGASGAVCDQHDARVAEFERASRISTMGQGWTPQQRALFDKVYRSFSNYAEVSHEMDCFGGTAQAACAIEGANADTEEFTRRIEVLASGQVPKDARVNRMEKSPAVSPPDLAEFPPDEREWYRHNRDASIAARAVFERDLLVFAAAVFPQYSRHQVRVMFRDL